MPDILRNQDKRTGLTSAAWRDLVPDRFSYYPIDEIPSSQVALSSRPAIRNKPSSKIYPKLRNDAIVVSKRDGVILRNDRQELFVNGRYLRPLLEALTPVLSGENSLQELTADLDSNRQHALDQIVRLLLEGGILTDAKREPLDLVSEALRSRFSSQIAILDHLADRPLARFSRFRASRLLLVGQGESFLACARQMLNSGLERISLLCTEKFDGSSLEATVRSLQDDGIRADFSVMTPANVSNFDLVSYCADYPSFHDLRLLNRACCQEQVLMRAAFAVGNQTILGPLISPPQASCLLCSLVHLVYDDGARNSALFRNHLVRPSFRLAEPTASQTLGAEMAFELFKVLAGAVRAQTYSNMLLSTLEDESGWDVKVIPEALCTCLGYCKEFLNSDT